MKYDAILFDFDGVLMDSEPVHFACWREVLRTLGIRVEWETYAAHCVGASEPATMEFFARLAQPPREADEIRALYPAKMECFARRMEQELPFTPGIREFLTGLDGRYRAAVVSSSSRAELEPLLERGGIRRCFQALVFGEDVERHKPAPDPYLLAARLVGARAPLVVEDSDAGMESARGAGFDAVRIPAAARTVELVRAALEN